MIFDVWMPHYSYSNPTVPLSIGVNFALDGIIYLFCLFIYFRLTFDDKREISGFKSDLRSAWKRHLVAISLHVVVGYMVDYLVFFNYERVIIKSGYSVTPLSEVFTVWGLYFLFLTLCQGLVLRITLHRRFTRYKINLMLGAILFGLLTNPMNLTLPYYLNYWMSP